VPNNLRPLGSIISGTPTPEALLNCLPPKISNALREILKKPAGSQRPDRLKEKEQKGRPSNIGGAQRFSFGGFRFKIFGKPLG
jgi:hypothetical protein